MAFSEKLEAWYNDFGRTLPWRGIDDPYRIWLSEIILQQTRIEQGRDYWLRFVEVFPTVDALATASEEQVLRLWQGLGYYSRARNLHTAAQYIMNECNGRFPTDYDGIRRLNGVGRYTAAAIASFAFRLPYPVIDGNVYRFIARLRGISTPIGTDAAYSKFEKILLSLIDRRRPDIFNAALMDFGSLQCRPVPDCRQCPFNTECNALRTSRVSMLPVKATKAKPTDRWFYYFDLRWYHGDTECLILHRRSTKDIWHGLYEFPLLETDHRLTDDELYTEAVRFIQDTCTCHPLNYTVTNEHRHQLTHRTIHARFIRADLPQQPISLPENTLATTAEGIKKIPLPRLIDRYLQLL